MLFTLDVFVFIQIQFHNVSYTFWKLSFHVYLVGFSGY